MPEEYLAGCRKRDGRTGGWLWGQSQSNCSSTANSLLTGKISGILASNRFKHFDEDVADGLIQNQPAPVWITNTGLRCREKSSGNLVDLSFVEIAELLEQLRSKAKFLASDVYEQARKHLERDQPTDR